MINNVFVSKDQQTIIAATSRGIYAIKMAALPIH